MSKSGGIAYLLKHGRAPFPVTTRTQQPRAKGVKRMADGGAAAERTNAYLNYPGVPNYDYEPSTNIAPQLVLQPDGTVKFVPGKYQSGTYTGGSNRPTTGGPAGAGAGAGTGANSGAADGGGREMGIQTDYGAVIGDPSASGKTWNELTQAQQEAYSAKVDPHGIGSLIAKGVMMAVPGATFIPGVLDNLMGRKGAPNQRAAPIGGLLGGLIGGIQPTSTNAQIANAYSPEAWGNISSTPGTQASPAGNIAANPHSIDPAQAAAARAAEEANWGGGRDGTGWGGGASSVGGEGVSTGSAAGNGGNNDAERGEARGGLNLGGKYYPHKMATGGITALARGGQPQHPRLLSGGGDGLSDDIPAVIGNDQPARLADGEFVVSADVVSALGGGSTKAGAKKLYAMMDRIRQNAHGTKKQVKKVNERKVLPA